MNTEDFETTTPTGCFRLRKKNANKENVDKEKNVSSKFHNRVLHDLKTRNSTYWEHFQEPQSLGDDESGKH